MKIRVEHTFDSATSLPGHDRCEGLHGHTYRVECVVSGTPHDGLLSDFRDVRKVLRGLCDPLDHQDLSLKFDYPSCEVICLDLAQRLRQALPGFESLRVWEGEGKWVELNAKELA